MMSGLSLLFAATTSRTYFELMRLRQLDEWWHWLLMAVGCLLVLAAVTTMYLLDTRGMARGKRWKPVAADFLSVRRDGSRLTGIYQAVDDSIRCP